MMMCRRRPETHGLIEMTSRAAVECVTTRLYSVTFRPSSYRRAFSTLMPKKEDDTYAMEKSTWVERHVSREVQPYLQLTRLNRPAGTFMLLWPSYWSIVLAAPHGQALMWSPEVLQNLGWFGLGSIIMRSAGCTINDMWDADFDRQVERTNRRPLAARTLSQRQALAFLGLQLSAGLGILVQLNPYSMALGASSLGLVVAYPYMKRITHWPQAFLGLTFNWGKSCKSNM